MILCAGEALIDMLPRKTVEGGDAFAPHAGGSVFNTAIALGRLGAPVQFFSGLSSDLFGDILRAELAASGVDAGPAAISDRPTTLAFVKLTDGHASYAFYDENTAGRMIAPDDLPDVAAEALFFGGISLVVEPCGSAYEALMLREAASRVMMIDPNIRPGFITDEASYRDRLTRMLGVADIIKTSDEDLTWMTGEADAGALLRETDAKVALLTRGGDGVTIVTEGGAVDVPAEKAEVVDTVGAGDTFSAGFLASLDRQGVLTKEALPDVTDVQLAEAAAFGAKVAAITVSRAGANPPWASEL
ncbi:carbohydrate kinase [Cognatiyoonia sp. IB215182]|uniref:carbohydrate kinase family protein n=1 Tax=Cognatiyoonia sp. IB215182 TaxID=3097353 RepID=UPI002A0E069D|nr:carbohydrate kinase [Cognatiyoonia sp. IB215182]MDX8351027.1 carbohydrate kinase [Cognatiyoonia sp. IB215182]